MFKEEAGVPPPSARLSPGPARSSEAHTSPFFQESARRALEPPAHTLPDSAPPLPKLLPLKKWCCDSVYLSESLPGPL